MNSVFFFFKHKTAYEMRISDCSSDVCSSDLGVDLSGFKVTRAPTWTLKLNANYEHEFDFGTVGVSGNMYHADDVPLEQSGRVQQEAYTLFNGTISFSPLNSNLKFSVWGKNLSNEKLIQGSFFTGAGAQVAYAPTRRSEERRIGQECVSQMSS